MLVATAGILKAKGIRALHDVMTGKTETRVACARQKCRDAVPSAWARTKACTTG